MKKVFCLVSLCFLTVACPQSVKAQYCWQEDAEPTKLRLDSALEYRIDMQATFSKGKTPLWLNANRYGLSSLKEANAYLRGSLIRPLSTDNQRRWGVGYGVDLALPTHFTSRFIVQQAFAEVRWLHGVLSVGAKEYPMELKNQTLSSGSQTLGINARPVPQVRLALPEYWTLPIFNHWVQLKGHIAFGKFTDENWQHDFTQRKSKYSEGVLYHSKAGYLRIGNEAAFCPLSIELGLEMAAQFGGKPYTYDGNGGLKCKATEGGLKGMWHAFIPGGHDDGEGQYANIAGNQLGSWLMRINYNADTWKLGIYADHFFEDDSQMFMLDYNGYGEGKEWQSKKSHRFFMYSLQDMMLGAELNIKYGRWIRNVVLEYVHTKYQSGPYNHDHTVNIPDHLAGMDNYYNHSNYTGWQHWGQVMGNPLYRSPIYNTDGKIEVKDNRFIAYHLGFDGQPSDKFGYRVLASYQKGWGTYVLPFTKKHHNVSFMAEGSYHFLRRYTVKAAYGMDFGSTEMLGHNRGFQITLTRQGIVKF